MHLTFHYRACAALLPWVCLAGCAAHIEYPADLQEVEPAQPDQQAQRPADIAPPGQQVTPPAAVAGPAQPVGSPTGPLRSVMLETHNDARAEVGAQRLQWDDALAAEATAYARKLAGQGRFEHSSYQGTTDPQGENLWQGTRGAFSYEEMARYWIGEKRQYRGGQITIAKANSTGHYTQIIWRNTTRFGCGMASNQSNDVLVCRYWPAGNVIGEKP